jgi:hypothetical protein
VLTGSEARYRACAQLQPDEFGHHSFTYGENDFLMARIKGSMANITSLMAEITSGYGENYLAPWQKLFRYGENSPEGDLQWRKLRLYGDGCFFR